MISEFPSSTVIVKDFVFEPAEFLAFTVKVYVPAFVNVPLNTPDELNSSPGGSADNNVTLHVGAGVPVAVNTVS